MTSAGDTARLGATDRLGVEGVDWHRHRDRLEMFRAVAQAITASAAVVLILLYVDGRGEQRDRDALLQRFVTTVEGRLVRIETETTVLGREVERLRGLPPRQDADRQEPRPRVP